MSIAIIAPCPVPLRFGVPEQTYRRLQDEINRRVDQSAEIIKLPTDARGGFWELIDAYARFSDLDLSGFDQIVSLHFPAWMVQHRDHSLYLLAEHRLSYDLYPEHLPVAVDAAPAEVARLLRMLEQAPARRDVLGEVLDRLEDLRLDAENMPAELFALPGPFTRAVIRWLDRVGTHRLALRRRAAASERMLGPARLPHSGTDWPLLSVDAVVDWLVAT